MQAHQIGALIEECNHQANRIHRKALIHKWLANSCNFTIIVGSSLSGVMVAYKRDELSTVALILSFGVATLKSLMVFYTPETRASILERISIEIARLSRKLRRLDTADTNYKLVKRVVDRAHDKLDELRIKEFGGDIIKNNLITGDEKKTPTPNTPQSDQKDTISTVIEEV